MSDNRDAFLINAIKTMAYDTLAHALPPSPSVASSVLIPPSMLIVLAKMAEREAFATTIKLLQDCKHPMQAETAYELFQNAQREAFDALKARYLIEKGVTL